MSGLALVAPFGRPCRWPACAKKRKPTPTYPGPGSAARPAPALDAAASGPGPVGSQTTGALPGSAQDFVVNVGDRVYFDTDSHDVRAPTPRRCWTPRPRGCSRYPGVSVRIEGNADERGTREYNLALGARRANSVRDYLVGRGVAAGRIATISLRQGAADRCRQRRGRLAARTATGTPRRSSSARASRLQVAAHAPHRSDVLHAASVACCAVLAAAAPGGRRRPPVCRRTIRWTRATPSAWSGWRRWCASCAPSSSSCATRGKPVVVQPAGHRRAHGRDGREARRPGADPARAERLARSVDPRARQPPSATNAALKTQVEGPDRAAGRRAKARWPRPARRRRADA